MASANILLGTLTTSARNSSPVRIGPEGVVAFMTGGTYSAGTPVVLIQFSVDNSTWVTATELAIEDISRVTVGEIRVALMPGFLARATLTGGDGSTAITIHIPNLSGGFGVDNNN